MYTAAKQMETEQRSRLGKIQSQLQALHVKQKQLAEVITFRPSALSVTAPSYGRGVGTGPSGRPDSCRTNSLIEKRIFMFTLGLYQLFVNVKSTEAHVEKMRTLWSIDPQEN